MILSAWYCILTSLILIRYFMIFHLQYSIQQVLYICLLGYLNRTYTLKISFFKILFSFPFHTNVSMIQPPGLRGDGYVRAEDLKQTLTETKGLYFWDPQRGFWSIFPKFWLIFSKFRLIFKISGNCDPLRGKFSIFLILRPYQKRLLRYEKGYHNGLHPPGCKRKPLKSQIKIRKKSKKNQKKIKNQNKITKKSKSRTPNFQ